MKRILLVILSAFIILLSSCYSVRVVNKESVPEPDPTNMSKGFYRGKLVHVIDTTVRLKLTEGDFFKIENSCSPAGFYSYEYRVTFGGILLNVITFGRKRMIRVKYVCTKPEN